MRLSTTPFWWRAPPTLTAARRLRRLSPLGPSSIQPPQPRPPCDATTPGLTQLVDALASARNLLFISGAGISTASGIPDYRSPGRPQYRPLQHHDFMTLRATRQRYWARSFVGFPRMQHALPNAGHLALAALQASGRTCSIVTQNVDRLHHKAGSTGVLELHGTLFEVECTACSAWSSSREELQHAMEQRNAGWRDHWATIAAQRPDGDVELPAEAIATFISPACPACAAEALKPRVVFFGGSIAAPVSNDALRLAENADAVVVLGSTLSTWSALRLVKAAHAKRAVVGIVNSGATRADGLADFTVAADIGAVLGWTVPQAMQRADRLGTMRSAPVQGYAATTLLR